MNHQPEFAAFCATPTADQAAIEGGLAMAWTCIDLATDDAQRERLTQALRARLRRDVRLHCTVDPALIGGAVVRSGDMLIDGSLANKLQRLDVELTTG